MRQTSASKSTSCGTTEPRKLFRRPTRHATVPSASKQSPPATINSKVSNSEDSVGKLVRDVRNVVLSTASAVLLAYSAPSTAEAEQLRLSISRNEEVMQVQESMLESWSIIDDVFFDSSTLVRSTQTNAVRQDDRHCRRQRYRAKGCIY